MHISCKRRSLLYGQWSFLDSSGIGKHISWLCTGALSTVRSLCSTEGPASGGHRSVKTVLLTSGYDACFRFCGRTSFVLTWLSLVIDSTTTAFVMTPLGCCCKSSRRWWKWNWICITFICMYDRESSDSLAVPRLRLTALGFASYLVDPASSHMLVSRIKPCMSQYKLIYYETANGSLKQL